MGAPSYKRWRPILILVVFVFAVFVLLALTLTGSRPCALAVRFDGLTNNYGIFVLTNRSDAALQFRSLTESKSNGGWPTYLPGTVVPLSDPFDIGAHESRALAALLPANGTSVRLLIVCQEPWSRWDDLRWRTRVLFDEHHMPNVGRFISEGKPAHEILSSEVHK